MSETLEKEFRGRVRRHFAKLEPTLVVALRSLIGHSYPAEVFALSFEVFSDSFTEGFPARAFFMDRINCEYFLYVNGEATYPSPIDPELLDIDSTYPEELEDDFLSRDPDLNTWDIATSEFILWFSECWDKAGGARFSLVATIADHDSAEEFNLITRQWQPSYAAFDS
jgi:hypothetical protein